MPKRRRRKKAWSYTAGERPCTVTVCERKPGGPLYVRIWDPTARGGQGNWVRRSLEHSDRDVAEAYALDQAAKLKKGQGDLAVGRLTLKQVFGEYKKHRTPRKSPAEQKADARRIELWETVLGQNKDPYKITGQEWQSFIERRRTGELDSRGRTAKRPKPVRDRVVEIDCRWLRLVFGWAVRWRTGERYLMRENPLRGFEVPTEINPLRPVATLDRFEALRAVSDRVMVEIRNGEKPLTVRSYLSELLDLAHGTGRRISAICALRYEDLRLNDGPHGSIRWPASTDKMGFESVVPMSPGARQAVNRVIRERPGFGAAPMFPSPADSDKVKPMSRHLADKWLREAERLAGLEPQKGTLWHAFRRGWATSRKDLPDVDVAQAGGWRSLQALKASYQQADADTMYRVVSGGAELRDAKQG